jgi:hypothetical protein
VDIPEPFVPGRDNAMGVSKRTLTTGEVRFSKSIDHRVRHGTPGWSGAIEHALYRHQRCDWGVVDNVGKQLNDAAWIHDRLVVSTFLGPDQERFHLMTDGDRRGTRVVLCGEIP